MDVGEIEKAVSQHDKEGLVEKVEAALEEGIEPEKIISDGLSPGMEDVGDRYDEGECLLPDVMLSAEAVEDCMVLLRDEMEGSDGSRKVVLGTVEGDIHEIGRKIIGAVLLGGGFDVIDIGCGVPAVEFREKVIEFDADVVGASALMNTTVPEQKKVEDELSDLDVYTIYGGSPVDGEWVSEIGGDAYVSNHNHVEEEVRGFFD
ncbi:B12-binding domain-containing protein [Methanonatronarchaeum sp. AMET6-2]|uniref:cobalamin B12-binding domain-containing protein n=1 Tax=Methanonatronarchaeum sp. AMET6-2 TaxID=2933293 RepID=UPI0012109624|nr:B12-binding domain-containing protein [Methanonatronarchaeum sp. AMET6-2]RZN61730.1 MAG: hypothetical protein EF811_04700 [Methanonatronarchaeia archaeon]UOY10114.1 B12-binding domain-containing protein [Methanonatronarchaeum sp. AMET6-2]